MMRCSENTSPGRHVLEWLGLMIAFCAGCSPKGGEITTTPSPGVDRIPKTVAVYPLLSAPQPSYGRSSILSVRENRVYIVPPTETKLSVTPLSQTLTGLLSTELARYGFNLKELPVELPQDGVGSGNNDVFVVSLGLLKELRDNYGLEAILIGDAFFVRQPYYPSETHVTSAHLKVVDIESLEVLCQVTMSYDEYGRDLNNLAKWMAAELSVMAGLSE